MIPKQKILFVEDQKDARTTTTDLLTADGFDVTAVADAASAFQSIDEQRPDLILLDIGLPDANGFEVCRKLKSNVDTWGIPVVLLTARSEEADAVLGLEIGADDYIIKPFRGRELSARLRAALRRRNEPALAGDRIERGPFLVDLGSFTVYVNSKPVAFTPKEAQVLGALLRRAGQVVRRATVSEEVWGIDLSSTSRTIDIHVERVRRKIEEYGANLESIRGIGYRLDLP